MKTADKMLKEAEHSEMLMDEERAYVLFMKYFNVVSYIKKTADYKKQKVGWFSLSLSAKSVIVLFVWDSKFLFKQTRPNSYKEFDGSNKWFWSIMIDFTIVSNSDSGQSG